MKGIDELRDYARRQPSNRVMIELLEIAKRIETERSHTWRFCQGLERAAFYRNDVTLFGVDYIALPVDADGVPIRIGDKIKFRDEKSSRVREIRLTKFADGHVGLGVQRECGDYLGADALSQAHHAEPDVKELLEQLLDDWTMAETDEEEMRVKDAFLSKVMLRGDGDEG